MKNFSIKQKKIAHLIQKNIAVEKFPFKIIARSCVLSYREVLETIRQLLEKGFIRKFGAILHHQKAGYKENALVVWSVPVEQKEKAGNIFASFPFISHCYEREPAFMDKYNIFTMLHCRGRSVSLLIKEMVNATGIKDYLILKSVREYKKTSPEYF
ncbi:MAG: Lrp/AsnC family transcriptional regulator [Syntrophaceae bacterium]|nr:Lrp/AsnC family transcriptional regulator [Syntrophaceae bacterium]